jgi:hypothetical protein
MAKLAFTKLGLKVNDEIKTVKFNEQDIEVKQYLPVNEKLEVIAEVLNNSADDNNFANPVKVDVYTAIAVFEAYTNISFTEKQKENVTKLYDAVVSTGFYNRIIEAIPHEEINSLTVAIGDTIDAFYRYRNSVMGILENISTDYSNLNLDASVIQQKLADPENMELLRSVLSKLG